MKKNLLFVLLLILGISFCSNVFAVEVTIGEGTQVNTTTGAPAPYGTWYKAFRQQYIILASELNNQGGGPGNITSVAFNVDVLNNITPMNNFRIRMKHTTQTALTTTFETGDYQVVYQQASFTPVVGWNTHQFSTPFNWDGGSNLLVEVVTDVITGDYAQNASVFYTPTTFASSLRFQSDTANGDTGTTGTTTNGRSNMRFTMQQLDMQDMAALSISGNTTPTVGIASNYIVRVKNLSPTAQTNYSVKLMAAPNTELMSLPGTALNSMAEQNFTFNWNPTTAGPMQIFGRVVFTGDQNPANDNTPQLAISVQPEGIQAVTIGDGSQDARMPMDFFYKSSLYQCIYLDDELGFASGTITGMQLTNNFTTNTPNGAAKIWLGNVAQSDLSAGAISSNEMTLVFDGNLTLPSGTNNIVIPFTTPFARTPGNMVMMIKRPLDGSYYSSLDYFKCQTIGNNRARNSYSDTIDYDPVAPPAGSLTGQFPKATFFYTSATIGHDLGALSITGNTTPSVGSPTPYTIRIKNNGSVVESNYQVKLMQQGGAELASIAGPAIQPLETLEINLNWTPSTTGPASIYGMVVLAGDEIASNNQTPNLNVVVQAAGIVAITVGAGGGTDRMPMDFYWKNSLFETIYLANELNIGGLLTGIQFYNNFTSNLQNKPTNIWVGETTQTDLAAGWIPSTQLTQVFAGNVNYPAGPNNILITLDTPYPYGGGNLVVMVERPMDADYFSSSDNFVVQSGTVASRTRKVQSDSTDYDPANPPTATPVATFPKATFMFITQGMGSLGGTVYGPGNTPLAGATVSVATTNLVFTTGADGTYSFPYISQGTYQVTATKHGHTSVTHSVTIVEDQTTTQNFNIALLPQVSVTGRIVGSDAPTVGIADATIALSGYEAYTATTNAQGVFTIPNVFASQTYNYVANALGYATATGTLPVGTTNVNMGDITVNEVAYPPHSVIANESADFQSMNLTWESPVPGGAGFEDDFESYDNFVTAFGDWTLIDVDQSTTYGFSGVSFPHSGEAMSFIIFNTNATNPPIEGHPAHSGEKVAACFASTDALNNDWMITPQVLGGGEVRFWARTYMDYGLERFKLGVSTTGTNPADFTIISGGNYVQVPLEWTEYVYDLSAYAGQQIHVGLNCVSDDCFILFVDDFYVGPTQFRASKDVLASSSITSTTPSVRYAAIERAKVEASEISYRSAVAPAPKNAERSLTGYKVYRLLAADMQNEANWTTLTTNTITPTNYTDNAWGPLPSGVYRYAVKAAYTNNVLSNAAFSAEIHKGMMGILTGTVTEFGTNNPIAGVTVTAGSYSGITNAQGVYNFSVYAGTYTVTAAKTGYQTASQPGVVITGLQTTTQNFVLTEITLPPAAVQAEEAGNNVNITWMAPGTAGGEWISYCGEQDDAIGTGSAADFDVAIRFPASALTDYAGMSLHAVKVYPHEANCAYSVRVWTGGTPSAPGTMVVDQPFTHQADALNTVILNEPVTITGTEELWFGMRCNTQTGYPAGCDAGPATDGFGNMMYFQGAWSTLLELASSLNYDWVIEGYVGYSAPDRQGQWISLKSEKPFNPNRAHEGYKVWRLLQGQESNEAAWTALTPNPISATGFQDTGWASVPDGMYKWAVKAVYTGGALSQTAFSNPLPKATQVGTIAGFVRNMQNQAISGATVRVGDKTGTSNASGAYSIQGVPQGTHSVTASHPNYSPVTINNVVVVTGQTTTVNFQLPPTSVVLEDGFESYADFALQFAPWVLVDVDQSTTHGFQGITFPNSGSAMAYIIFNPAATSPATESAVPHGGQKMAASFAATAPPNNDWLISPVIPGGGQLKFWARSFVADYGLERFKVGVSTGGTAPENFTIISGASHISAPVDWTEYTYDLSAYNNQNIRFGIQCVSNDAFIFFVDDVRVTGPWDNEDLVAPVYTTELKGNFPNPFNPETTIRYSVKDRGAVSIDIYNVKGQLVRNLVNDVKDAGEFSAVWNGTDNNGRAVSSGVYYFKMNAGKYSSTKKMIMMK